MTCKMICGMRTKPTKQNNDCNSMIHIEAHTPTPASFYSELPASHASVYLPDRRQPRRLVQKAGHLVELHKCRWDRHADADNDLCIKGGE